MDWKNIFRKRAPRAQPSLLINTPRRANPPLPARAGHIATAPQRSRPAAKDAPGALSDQMANLGALLAAWRKVKANHGSAGVDGVSLQEFEKNLRANLEALSNELTRGAYRPQPVKRVYVPKPSGGARPLAILAVKDRIVQRALYDLIAPRFDRQFLDCSFGFREGRSRHDAVARVVDLRERGLRWVVDGDIKQCFENLDHRLLMSRVRSQVRDDRVLQLIEQWLKARVFNELDGRDLTVGTYQGGVLSPLLANIYLHAFDAALTRQRYNLIRYADDWLILCGSEPQARAALEAATRALSELRLAINPYKTRVVTFDQGFRFVGTFFVRSEHFDLSPSDTRPPFLDRG